MVVDQRRKLGTPLRGYATPVESDCGRNIDRSPAHQPAAPGKIRILAIGKEILIEELTVNRDILERLQSIECRSAAGSEYIFGFVELTQVRLICSAVEMPLAAQHDDAG